MDVLCIVDQDHQKWAIAVDHSSKFKVILSMINSPLMAYNTENWATIQELPEKSTISGKIKRNLLFETRKKKSS